MGTLCILELIQTFRALSRRNYSDFWSTSGECKQQPGHRDTHTDMYAPKLTAGATSAALPLPSNTVMDAAEEQDWQDRQHFEHQPPEFRKLETAARLLLVILYLIFPFSGCFVLDGSLLVTFDDCSPTTCFHYLFFLFLLLFRFSDLVT